jgi:hypothetical protein
MEIRWWRWGDLVGKRLRAMRWLEDFDVVSDGDSEGSPVDEIWMTYRF